MSLEYYLESLERLSARLWRQYAKEDPLSQLSFNEYDYLIAIKIAGEIRITDLASEMGVSNPSASNMAKKLEAKALVRKITCNQDSRVHRIALTEKSVAYLQEESYVYGMIAEKLRVNLTDTEVDMLNRLLDKAIASRK